MNFNFVPFISNILLFEWIVRLVMLFVVPRHRKPSSANAWLLLIMIAPTIGTVLYYMFGDPKLPRGRVFNRREVDKMTHKELTELNKSHDKLMTKFDNKDHATVSELAKKLGGMPPMNGNKVEIIGDYDSLFSNLVTEIDNAKEYIHMQYFIAVLDDATRSVFDALERAVKRGVKVRFLYDQVLSRHYHRDRKLRRELERIGVQYVEMLPLRLIPGKKFTRPDLRNHRKIVVIDGIVEFTGSQNLIDKSYHRRDNIVYEEINIKTRGPIVWQYNNIFRADWYGETKEALLDLVEDADMPPSVGDVTAQLLPTGPAHDHDNNLKFYTSMVHTAKKRVGIVVPYFIPDESFMDALITAAQRGVHSQHDQFGGNR